jgi:hypothetical protein
MTRMTALIFALASSFTLISTAAVAQPTGGFYSMSLAQPAREAKPVVRGMLLSCNGAACTAGEGTSRPAIVCASIAREFGAVTAFRAGNESFDDAALAKCNAKAKASTTQFVQR